MRTIEQYFYTFSSLMVSTSSTCQSSGVGRLTYTVFLNLFHLFLLLVEADVSYEADSQNSQFSGWRMETTSRNLKEKTKTKKNTEGGL